MKQSKDERERIDELGRFSKDVEYYEVHRKDLLKKYPEQWVAVYGQHVVGADSDLERLLNILIRAGIPAEKAFVERVTDRDELLILLG
jgi:hypothetical protein